MRIKTSLLLPLALLLTVCEKSNANPNGGNVTAGSAQIFSTESGTLNINQLSDKVIIDWKNFSIAPGELTRFNQPGVNAAALNRVTGGNPSAIYGMLQGNGQIYLINPAGILVGPGGVINTHSFYGSTLDVSDSSFLSGAGMRFAGDSTAGFVNQGTISAIGGDVFLFAHTVENTGSISAPGGTVGLAAGSEILLQPSGEERVSVIAGNVTAPKSSTGVNNAGAVQAASAELKAAGGNIYALAINNGGIVRATTVVNEGGRILLRADGGAVKNSGTLDASSSTGKGGNVQVLGNSVTLGSGSLVDASGATGGGTVYVGGGFHGSGTSAPNTTQTTVENGAEIRANSTTSGDGGNVAVWSDDKTVFSGTIYARALGLPGNGGYVEVSGKNYLTMNGYAHLESAHGTFGTLLMDPGNVDIISEFFPFDTGPNIFADSFVRNQLGFGSFGISASGGSLTVDPGASLFWSVPTTLTLQGDLGVGLSGGSSVNNLSGNLTINSGIALSLDGSISVNNLNLTSGAQTTDDGIGSTTALGTTTLQAGPGKAITLTGANNLVGPINVVSANNFTLNDNGTVNLGASTIHANLNVTASTGISQSGTLNVTGTSTFTASGSGTGLNLTGFPNIFTGGVSLGSTAGASFGTASLEDATPLPSLNSIFGTINSLTLKYDNAGITLPASTVTGNLKVTANGVINDNGGLTVDGTTTLDAGTTHSIALGNILNFDNFVGSVSVLNADTETLVTGSAVTLGATSTQSALTVTANGDITESGILNVGGAAIFTVTAANANLGLGGFANLFGGGVTMATFGGSYHNVAVRDTTILGLPTGLPLTVNDLTLIYDNSGITLPAAETVNGNLVLSAKGSIADGGGVIVKGSSSITTTDPSKTISLGTVPVRDSFTGPLSLTAGNDVNLIMTGPVNLGASTIGGKLNLTTSGNISESGILNVTGAAEFAAASPLDLDVSTFANLFKGGLTLHNTGVNFNSIAIRDADAVPSLTGIPGTINGSLSLIYDNSGIAIGPQTISGGLNVTAKGDITQIGGGGGGPIVVTGATHFTETGAGATLDVNSFANTFTGGVTVGVGAAASYNNVKIHDTAASPSLAFTGTAGTIGNDLTLVYDNGGVVLPAATVTHNLSVTAAKDITQSGLLNVTGATLFTATSGLNLDVSTQANLFKGGLTLANTGANFKNIDIRDADNSPNLTGIPATVNGDLILLFDNSPILIGPQTISGKLIVKAAGNITQTGSLDVTGTSQFTEASALATFDLGTGANFFRSGVTLLASGLGTYEDVSLRDGASTPQLFGLPSSVRNLTLTYDNAGIQLPSETVTGTLLVTAAGNITQNGTLNVTTGASTFKETATGATLNLFGHPNIFFGGLTLSTGGAGSYATVKLEDATTLPSLNGLPGTFTDLSLQYDNAGIALPAATVSGNLVVTAHGNITENGALLVSGAAGAVFTETAALANLNVSGFANTFTHGVSLTTSGLGTYKNIALREASTTPSLSLSLPSTINGNLAIIRDNAGIVVPAETITGNLAVTAGGDITQSGLLSVTGTTLFTAISAATPVAVNLDVSGFANLFKTGVTLSTSAGAPFTDGTWNNVALRDADNVPNVILPSTMHDLTLTYDHHGITLQPTTVNGNLSLTAGGVINDAGTVNTGLTVHGTTTLNSGLFDTILGLSSLDSFGGAVSVVSANNFQLNSGGAVSFGAATIKGSLTVVAHGDITQGVNLPINVSGASGFTEASTLGNIDLSTSQNDFKSGVTILATSTINNVLLDNADPGTGGLLAAPALPAHIFGNLTLKYDNAGITFGSGELVNGNLNLTAKGAITDGGNNTVLNGTTVSAGTGNNITLGTAANVDSLGGGLTVTSGKDVSIVSGSSLSFGASTVSGNLSVSGNGSVSQTGALSVANGIASFGVGFGNNVLLNNSQNDFSTIAISSANNATFHDQNNLVLGNITDSGTISVTVAGSISQLSGTSVTAGGASLGAGGSVTLGAFKDFGALNFNTGGNVSQASGTTIQVSSINGAVGGNLQLGNPNTPFGQAQPVASLEPLNQIQSLGNITAGGTLYVFNSLTTAYSGSNPNPNPTPKGSDVLGLIIGGNVKSGGDMVIRTKGDLELQGKVEATSGSIQLASEKGGNFHNLAGATIQNGHWVAGSQTVGADAVKADNGRFLIYSTDRTLNFNNYIDGNGKVNFNGIEAGFIAQQISIDNHPVQIIHQDGTADNGTQNGFVFGQSQNFVQPDEVAKFYLDVERLQTSTDIDETTGADYLPPERPPTIWTSSYHIKLEEERDKKKKKKAKVVAYLDSAMEITLARD